MSTTTHQRQSHIPDAQLRQASSSRRSSVDLLLAAGRDAGTEVTAVSYATNNVVGDEVAPGMIAPIDAAMAASFSLLGGCAEGGEGAMVAPAVSSASPVRGDPTGESRSSTSMGAAVPSLHQAHIMMKHYSRKKE